MPFIKADTGVAVEKFIMYILFSSTSSIYSPFTARARPGGTFSAQTRSEIYTKIMRRGTSLKRDRPTRGPHSRPTPRALRWSQWGGRFLMSELPLYRGATELSTRQASVPLRVCPLSGGAAADYRGTSPIRPPPLIGPYRRPLCTGVSRS